jgi:glycine hydroxymethyltransferase
MIDVLNNTKPSVTSAGAPSKATYTLADGVAKRTRAASAELLDANPLYPGLVL